MNAQRCQKHKLIFECSKGSPQQHAHRKTVTSKASFLTSFSTFLFSFLFLSHSLKSWDCSIRTMIITEKNSIIHILSSVVIIVNFFTEGDANQYKPIKFFKFLLLPFLYKKSEHYQLLFVSIRFLNQYFTTRVFSVNKIFWIWLLWSFINKIIIFLFPG